MNNNVTQLNQQTLENHGAHQNIVPNQQSTISYIPYYAQTQGTDMVMSPSILKIAPALLKAQGKMTGAVKDAKNPFFKSSYADLNAVREACTPALHENEILVLQPMIQKDGKSFVRTLLLHSSGEYFGSDTEVVCAKQNDPQAQGSAITYARRYGLQSLVSLGSADDDGEGAMNRSDSRKQWRKEASEELVELAPKKARTAPKPTFSQTANLDDNGQDDKGDWT